MGRFLHSLQGKLLATVAGGLAVILAVSIYSVGSLHSVAQEYSGLVKGEFHALNEVDTLNIEFKRQVQEWKNVLLRGHNQSDLNKYWGQFEQTHKDIQDRSKRLLGQLEDEKTKSQVAQFQREHLNMYEAYKQGKDAFVRTGFDHKEGDKAVKGIDRAPSQALSELAASIDKKAAEQTKSLAGASEGTFFMAIAELLAVAAVMFTVLMWALRHQFITPLNQIAAHIKVIAEGDFSRELSLQRDDELGRLSKVLDDMKDDLGGMIAGIRTTVTALQGATGELNASSDNISKATADAESFSGQIAASITEMAHTVSDVASNAANAAEATQTADKSAQEGLSVMNSALSAISGVASEVSAIAGDITKLENDTTSVGAVLDVIKGIAEQTNLLALNAAIEAARAGEQGRGFAVVADEVRALAKRTQESTEEIQHIIETVQNGAASAAVAMQAGNQKTVDAVKLAEEAGGFIRSISEAVGHIRDMNNQIAAASEEQSVAADEISRNIVNMSDLAESAQTSSERSRGVTQSLEQTARDLSQIVGRFKV